MNNDEQMKAGKMKTTKTKKSTLKKLTLLVIRSAILDCFSYVYDPDLTYEALANGKLLRGDVLRSQFKNLSAKQALKQVLQAQERYLAFATDVMHICDLESKNV